MQQRDAHRCAVANFTQLKLQVRALTGVLQQSITTRNSGPCEEAEERCFGPLAWLAAQAEVSCTLYCPAPAEACIVASAVHAVS